MANFDLQMRDWFKAACIKRRVSFAEGISLLREDVGTGGGPVLALRDKRDEGGGSEEESECSRLEGLALKNALDAAGQERLVALMDRREAARVALQAEKRERAMYGGRTLAEIQEGGTDEAA